MKELKTHVCLFVLASDMFKGLPKAHDALSESGKFTWGDCNRSLVTACDLARELDCHDDERQCKAAANRLRKMGETYVDLEN